MRKAVAAIAALASLVCLGIAVPGLSAGQDAGARIVIRGHDGGVLASAPLGGVRDGAHFAVSYRNSIYGTLAEERYAVLPDGRFRLVQIAADQLAVLEEYYALATAPRRAGGPDRREWVAPPDPAPDPARPAVFETLSIAATDLGKRTVHIPGQPPIELWRLAEDEYPFVVLDIETSP
ncbi:MAG TPA: hypothetical protein VFJ13_05550 [Paracoccaceae bacterium]|nr:hypothetical protein [Paracoccaceae bacterium]